MGVLPRIPRSAADDFDPASVQARLELCERAAGRALPHLAGQAVAPDAARGKVENLIGYAQVPVGIAGPLVVDTHLGTRSVYVPLATTEGAMVASYSRGMKLLSAAGGARARVVREGLTQHPVLVYPDAAAALRAELALPELREQIRTTLHHELGHLRGEDDEVLRLRGLE